MKSNSSKKKDYLSFVKPILTVCFALIVLASVLVGFYGFRAGVDINGGTQLVVDFVNSNVEIEDDAKLNEASSKVREILQNNNVNVNSFQVQGEFGTKTFIVTFQKTSQMALQNIRLAINEEFNATETYAEFVTDENEVGFLDNNYDLTRRTSTIDSFISSDEFMVTVSTLIFALSILIIYALFRVKLAGALAIFFGAVLNIVMTLVFIVIARVEINSYIFAIMGLILAISIYMSADFSFEMKAKMKEHQFADKSAHELANIVVEENLKRNYVISICSLVGLIIIGLITSGNIMYVALASLVGVVVVIASHIFVVPAMFVFFSRKRELLNAMKAKESIKSTKTNEVENVTNDVDKSAEVIEIDDKEE